MAMKKMRKRAVNSMEGDRGRGASFGGRGRDKVFREENNQPITILCQHVPGWGGTSGISDSKKV